MAAQLLIASLGSSPSSSYFTRTTPPLWSPLPVVSVVLLGALGTGTAFVLNFQVIKVAGALTAATVTYATPIVSTVPGSLCLAKADVERACGRRAGAWSEWPSFRAFLKPLPQRDPIQSADAATSTRGP